MVEATSSPDLLTLFGLNGYLLAAQLVNFLIVLFVVHRWIYKPLLRTLDQRSEHIRVGLAKADAAESVLQAAQKESGKLIHSAEQAAHALLEKTKGEAAAKRRELLLEAKAELDRQIEQTKLQLQEERVQMVHTAKRELAGLVVQATDAVTDAVLVDEERRTILEKTVKQLTR